MAGPGVQTPNPLCVPVVLEGYVEDNEQKTMHNHWVSRW